MLVIVFHAYARWPELYPYGAAFADVAIFEHGWLGVQLFFLISGFVIMMTLEKASGIRDFLYRRWLRLFPAMLFCSLLVFATAPYFRDRPYGDPTWNSLLPGLTFIDVSWWRIFFKGPNWMLEGAFWSLFVEVKFYVFAAVVYYWRGRNALIVSLLIAYLVGITVTEVDLPYPMWGWFKAIAFHSSAAHFGWFAAGAGFYVFTTTQNCKWFYGSVAVALMCAALVQDKSVQAAVAASAISLFFGFSLISPLLQRLLNSRFFLGFGYISYPLYLIHESAMVASISMLSESFPQVPHVLLPVLPFLGVVFLACVITAAVEKPLRSALARVTVRISAPYQG